MSYNYKTLLPTVINAINNYGIDISIYRDFFESEVGVQTYKETKKIAQIKGIIDNSSISKTSATTENEFKQNPISGTLYYSYDKDLDIQQGDFLIVNNIKYILDIPVDVLEVGLLYQCSLRGVKIE
jgi:hypothetical protein|uniref:hypothetical protein n=1 Tax=Candidatus Stercorousia sp. TaxID=3048886 RepID=UPI002050CF62|nr:MAG TPA: hypothetical protein [Caudoviricetes sp.]